MILFVVMTHIAVMAHVVMTLHVVAGHFAVVHLVIVRLIVAWCVLVLGLWDRKGATGTVCQHHAYTRRHYQDCDLLMLPSFIGMFSLASDGSAVEPAVVLIGLQLEFQTDTKPPSTGRSMPLM